MLINFFIGKTFSNKINILCIPSNLLHKIWNFFQDTYIVYHAYIYKIKFFMTEYEEKCFSL